jgi:hypothetical protein
MNDESTDVEDSRGNDSKRRRQHVEDSDRSPTHAVRILADMFARRRELDDRDRVRGQSGGIGGQPRERGIVQRGEACLEQEPAARTPIST